MSERGALANNDSISRTVDFPNAAAALSVTQLGAQPQALGVLLRSIVVEREPYHQQETAHGFASGLYGLSAKQLKHLRRRGRSAGTGKVCRLRLMT
jgi:hypothetical protein